MTQLIVELADVRAWLAAHDADADYVQSATIKISAALAIELELLEYERGPQGIAMQPGLTSPRLILTTRPLLSLPKVSTAGYGQNPTPAAVGFVDAVMAADIMRHATDATDVTDATGDEVEP